MSVLEVVVALVMLVGLLGVIVPVLPGVLLVAGALVVWAWQTGGPEAWTVCAAGLVFLAAGQVVKYAVPGRRLKLAGIPASTLAWGGVGAVAGFFVIPVVGLLVGFVGGVYLAERQRVGAEQAWPATVHALKAAGWSILIELVATCLAIGAWVLGVVLT